MNFHRRMNLLLLAGSLWLVTGPTASAQLDRVYDKAGDNIGGTIVQTSKQGVQLKRGDSTQNFAAGDILKIMHEGDPGPLTKAREFALDGQYDQALSELKNVNFDAIRRPIIEADAGFYLVLCESKLALRGKGNKEEAARKALSYLRAYQDTWHFYEVAKLLGDLALAQNDAANALRYYKSLMSAPAAETKIESVYLQGLVHIKQADSAAALAEFEKVIGLQAQSTQTARLQILSKAGKAVALAQSGKAADGLALVKRLIAELNPADVEMSARIYNAQGASYEASGDIEGAILSYLHTHLMFSTQPDAHAEALKKLVELWPQVGKPERAAAARTELQQRYPGF